MDNTAETFEKSSEAKVGVAVVDQGRIIPLSGERKVTTRREYWAYCIFCQSFFLIYRPLYVASDKYRYRPKWYWRVQLWSCPIPKSAQPAIPQRFPQLGRGNEK